MTGNEPIGATGGDTVVSTSHARIALRESTGRGSAVILIHGNSASKEVFAAQLDGPLGATYRMIAMDLPGHGASSDAHNPARTYNMPGYADAILEVIAALEIERAALFGWSLGGHVALELMARWPGATGVMLTGAPPVAPTMESMQAGFLPHATLGFAGKEELTDEEARAFVAATCGPDAPAAMLAMVKRTDGRARRMMVEHLFAGRTSDQRAIAESATVPVAFVNGEHEIYANPDYLAGLHMRNLWEGRSHILPGLGHAPFYEAPAVFNPILLRFLRDTARKR